MNDIDERSCASCGSRSIREHFRISVQAGLFNSLKSIHTANVLLETVILPAFDEVPAIADEEREAIEYVLNGLLPDGDREGDVATDALRGLLARLK